MILRPLPMLTYLQSVFIWFYCLPYEEAAEYMLVLALLVLILKGDFDSRAWFRPALGTCLLAWLAVLAYATVFSRPAGDYGIPNLTLFHSYREVDNGGSWEILLSNYMNIMLFFPGGLFLSAALPGRWHPLIRLLLTVLFFLLFSAGMEYLQYRFCLGRVEVDDVFHNTLGALAGSLFGILPPLTTKRERG